MSSGAVPAPTPSPHFFPFTCGSGSRAAVCVYVCVCVCMYGLGSSITCDSPALPVALRFCSIIFFFFLLFFYYIPPRPRLCRGGDMEQTIRKCARRYGKICPASATSSHSFVLCVHVMHSVNVCVRACSERLGFLKVSPKTCRNRLPM